jgi:hypothetical protein
VVVRGAGRKLKVKVNGRAVASVFDRASGIVTWEVPNARAVIQIEWR